MFAESYHVIDYVRNQRPQFGILLSSEGLKRNDFMLTALSILAGITVLATALFGLHRLALKLDEMGYLYYKTQPKGGHRLGGVLMEFDKLTRPSVEHTLEANEDAERISRAANDGE
jgi:hypothetical protein